MGPEYVVATEGGLGRDLLRGEVVEAQGLEDRGFDVERLDPLA